MPRTISFSGENIVSRRAETTTMIKARFIVRPQRTFACQVLLVIDVSFMPITKFAMLMGNLG